MKTSDYIVELLADNGVDHVFGYQGTMIAHFIDSICKSKKITNHSCQNEQGAAFAAVGYAKATGRTAVAYATSGPGAVNLFNGIADAYYDSAPVVFITGQLNTHEYTGISDLRQQGFQEMDVVSAVKRFTKYAVQIKKPEDIRYEFEKAFYIAGDGRKGPVLIDLPMDMQNKQIEPELLREFPQVIKNDRKRAEIIAQRIWEALRQANRPLLLFGNGIVKGSQEHQMMLALVENLQIPVITSLLGRHLLPADHRLNFGYIGAAYGHRYANILAHKKSDLIVSFGCSVCKRQTGTKSRNFARDAKIIRVDIDPSELQRKVHDDDTLYCIDCGSVIESLLQLHTKRPDIWDSWLKTAEQIRLETEKFDAECQERKVNHFIELISDMTDQETEVICTDVGQHQMWTGQSYHIKGDQKLLFSGGHGAMGFALPAAIGAHYATGKRTLVLAGDGAMQMNIQELQWVKRENIPVTIVVLNNRSLGLIRQQQDDFFGGLHFGADPKGGYSAPSFAEIAKAYGIDAYLAEDEKALENIFKALHTEGPVLVEVLVGDDTGAYPKTYFGEEMDNQKPYMDKSVLENLLKL